MGFLINPYLVQPSGPSYDADAQAFFTAAGITDTTQKSAVNQLVLDLKSYSIWTKMKALYPFVGGTSTTHKYNLKDPQDSDAAFRLVFSGGITHSSTGLLFNGTNGFADTKLIPSSVSASQDSLGISFYCRTNNAVDYICDIGCWNYIGGIAKEIRLFNRISSNTSLLRIATSGFSGDSGSVTDSRGFLTGTRTSSSSQKLYRNGSAVITGTTSSSVLPDNSIYIGASHSTSITEYYSNREYALAAYHDGLNDTESSNFYTAVQTFQTTLSRSV